VRIVKRCIVAPTDRKSMLRASSSLSEQRDRLSAGFEARTKPAPSDRSPPACSSSWVMIVLWKESIMQIMSNIGGLFTGNRR
jgi:hypothetical protein